MKIKRRALGKTTNHSISIVNDIGAETCLYQQQTITITALEKTLPTDIDDTDVSGET